MKGSKDWVVAIVTIWLAAVCQAIAPRFSLGAATPDFLLVALVVLSLHTDRRIGAYLGFAAGLLQGAMVGTSLGYYVVSRTVVGFAVSWSREVRLEHAWWAVFLTTASATAFALAMRLLLPPATNIPSFLTDTITTATYNGVLAIPLYALLNKLLAPVRV